MTEFGGWEMPLQFSQGILAEYQETRKGVTVFDTSHMGEFLVTGDVIASGLDRIVTQPLKNLATGSCHYGFMLNEQGGVIDDLIVYRLAADQWMIVVNAATLESDEQQFRRQLTSKAKFTNLSSQLGKLDVQGPQSRQVLAKFINGIERLAYYTFDTFDVLGAQVIVSRTGYTGELGYEIYYPWEKLTGLWQQLLQLQVKPAGLGARDVLRMEMGYSLYGHELSENISPLESGLNKFIDWNKDFIGKAALLRQRTSGLQRKVVSLISNTRRSPRTGLGILSSDKKKIGIVTSGTFSPSLQRGIGMGLVSPDFSEPGRQIVIDDAREPFSALIAKRPLYISGTFKN